MGNGNFKKHLEEFNAWMLENERATETTLTLYNSDINNFIKFIVEKFDIDDVSDISNSIINSYLLHIQETKKESTVRRNYSSVRMFLKYCFSKNYVSNDFTLERVNIAKKDDKKDLDILTSAEVDRLLAIADNSILGIRNKAMLELIYSTGIKINELISLRVEDVDFTNKLLHINQTKFVRTVSLSQRVIESLKLYTKYSRAQILEGKEDGGELFVNYYGTRLSRQSFWKQIKKYSKEAGIDKNITLTTLRHSFAAHMLNNGIKRSALVEMLGNKSMATVDKYVNKAKKE